MEALEQVQVVNWALSGIAGFLIALVLMLIRNKLTNDAKIVEAINSLKLEVVKQNERITTLFQSNINTKADIKQLKEKVGNLEVQMAKCKNRDM